jgi:broad specificity phosphatase PhoE
MDRELLSTYLNDHLGGSTTGTELAERLVEQNKGTRYHAPLERVCAEIKEDRVTLQAIMKRLELEGLSTGVQGKLSLWQVLGTCSDAEPALKEFDLGELEARAKRQLEVLERQRIDAGREAFVGEPAPATEG